VKIQYFIPDWEDRLDPHFDFTKDLYSREKAKAYATDVYAHQIFRTAPYDGVLVSLATFDGGKLPLRKMGDGAFELRGRKTIRGYLRLRRPLEVMGDCGAFTYVNDDRPPKKYSTRRVADIYDKLRFDYGVSVDHMTVDFITRKSKRGRLRKIKLTTEEQEKRRQLSLRNAEALLEYWQKNHYRFIPVGAAQGMSPATYTDSVDQLLEMGYRYIGLGTLIPRGDDEIISILKAVRTLLDKLPTKERREIKLHLFGILRPKKLREFKKLGVSSLDSASYLRKAWLRSGQNYLTRDGRWYSAIRVPYSDNPRLLENADEAGISEDRLTEMESDCLHSLAKFEKRRLSVASVVRTVLKYDELLLRDFDGNHHEQKYETTLRARPWERCGCEVCRELGIHVVIFRGCNRNKRRGFHNTKMFYDYILNG
jgi:hypothetical protein